MGCNVNWYQQNYNRGTLINLRFSAKRYNISKLDKVDRFSSISQIDFHEDKAQ